MKLKAGQAKPVASSAAKVEIAKAKGRPMLSWVGKRALKFVTAFPAQFVEKFDPAEDAQKRKGELWSDWPKDYPKGGLLFHGDNKEVLAHLLLNGFRGKVKLIYIDPPFDSGADYVRKVTLRGPKGTAKLDGETYALGEQIQYTDIWANDNYLQFMFDRLLMHKELLSEDGVIVVHCDWKKSHHLRCLLDEVFGIETFRNEIYWHFYNKMHDDRKDIFPRATNTLLVYSKGDNPIFNKIASPREKTVKQLKRIKVNGILVNLKDDEGNLVYQESDTKTLDNVWDIPLIPPADVNQKTDYPTQKPQALLELILLTYSEAGDLVLDSFIGSGTTALVAQRWGRRWIGCDINKGAIQTTAKRLQGIIRKQTEDSERQHPELIQAEEKKPEPTQLSFAVYRVNDYDLSVQHNEAVNLACEHIGIERNRGDAYFDGILGKSLVKIIPFGRPLTPLDFDELRRELEARPDEDRPITLVCLGMELGAKAEIEEWNRLRKGKDAVNRVEVIELRTDPKYGKFMVHEPATAKVAIRRIKDKIVIEIQDFISPSIIMRLQEQAGLLKPKIDDWRAMVDCVMTDTAFDGKVFNVIHSDVPEKKTDFVQGKYELSVPPGKTTVAVKIIDMLGEEILCQETL
ncbi:MAG: site-specific DNA-methyltransferase [Elusimicrobia bacterium]|nr:site-specific DNA-methyltransferase [Elusimicrobiota bacterium]